MIDPVASALQMPVQTFRVLRALVDKENATGTSVCVDQITTYLAKKRSERVPACDADCVYRELRRLAILGLVHEPKLVDDPEEDKFTSSKAGRELVEVTIWTKRASTLDDPRLHNYQRWYCPEKRDVLSETLAATA